MSPEIIAILSVGVALAGFLWRIATQLGDVRERFARLEGSVDVLTKFLVDRDRRGAPAE